MQQQQQSPGEDQSERDDAEMVSVPDVPDRRLLPVHEECVSSYRVVLCCGVSWLIGSLLLHAVLNYSVCCEYGVQRQEAHDFRLTPWSTVHRTRRRFGSITAVLCARSSTILQLSGRRRELEQALRVSVTGLVFGFCCCQWCSGVT
jgi:hypothetical protein